VSQGRFRADLYYRLAGLDLFVPALRERAADIPALVRHFLGELRGSAGVCQISDEELRTLMAYRWPGNVRQLRHAVVRAASLCGPVLKAKDILAGQRSIAGGGGEGAVPVLGRRFSEIERDIYQVVLSHTNYNLRQTAAVLDVPRSSVSDKLRRFGLAVRRR
jgi:DNA-binding NtrC family response regulator